MLALDIFRELTDVFVVDQGLLDQLKFFVLSNELDDILESVGSSVVARDLDELLSFDLLQKSYPLVYLEILNQLRAEIITVIVHHKLRQVFLNLLLNLVYQWLFSLPYVVLQEFRSNLLGGKIYDVSIEHLELFLRIIVGKFNICLDLLHELVEVNI